MRAIGYLATKITDWDTDCDRLLHRLMCYIQSSKSHRLFGWIGDPVGDLELQLYCDADFAGDQETMKSTTGWLTTVLFMRR